MKFYTVIFTSVILFMWTTAEMEPEAEPTIEVMNQELEYEGDMFALDSSVPCRGGLKGLCINEKQECPPGLPEHTKPGRPYCPTKQDRCCYISFITVEGIICNISQWKSAIGQCILANMIHIHCIYEPKECVAATIACIFKKCFTV